MADLILVEGLSVLALVGIYPHEWTTRQPLLVDLALHVDVREAALGQDFRQTVDYERAAALAREVIESGHHKLVETVAESIAARLLAELGPRLERVRVRVAKPHAVPGARAVAVEIERERVM